jgi:DNA-binding MarR family transcriptional regulator
VNPAADADDTREPRLSQLQRIILIDIWSDETRSRAGSEVPWRPSNSLSLGTWRRARAAAVSRALRRLESRGLIERLPAGPAGARRTTHVRLTARGRVVAPRLSDPERRRFFRLG